MPITNRLEHIAALAALLDRPLTVVDVGCRWGFADTWTPFGRHINLIGFDPDSEECARIAREYLGRSNVQLVPAALGATTGPATLHQTVEPACSSLYPPALELLRLRPELACIDRVNSKSVHLNTLDNWSEAAGVTGLDYLKLDTQGSELDVLHGAERALGSVRALEVEVEFNEIYRGQPLFGDVDRFLRERGFVLWRLNHLVHYGFAGTSSHIPFPDRHYFDSRAVSVTGQGGQLYWGHAHYVRKETAFESEADWRNCLRDACLTAALGYSDLAGHSLARSITLAPSELRPAMRQALDSQARSGPEDENHAE
jgi:FkbM family methyltransferase